MLIRRSWVKAAFALLAGSSVSSGLVAERADAQEGFGNNFANSIDSMHLVRLEDQLRYGLRCARPGGRWDQRYVSPEKRGSHSSSLWPIATFAI